MSQLTKTGNGNSMSVTVYNKTYNKFYNKFVTSVITKNN